MILMVDLVDEDIKTVLIVFHMFKSQRKVNTLSINMKDIK